MTHRPRGKAIFLAAGVGSRLKPLTNTVPKCLVPIEGRPLLSYWFDALCETSITDVLINTHHHREQVSAFIDSLNAEKRFRIVESHEQILLGSAGTLTANRDWMDDADYCLIVYTDNLSNVDVKLLIDFHHRLHFPLTMMLFRTSFPSQCGIAQLDDESRVIDFVEKPHQPRSNLANAGVYVVSADAYREIADYRAFDLGHDVLPKFVGRMRGWTFDGYHRDVGTLQSLHQARQDVKEFSIPSEKPDAPGRLSRSRWHDHRARPSSEGSVAG